MWNRIRRMTSSKSRSDALQISIPNGPRDTDEIDKQVVAKLKGISLSTRWLMPSPKFPGLKSPGIHFPYAKTPTTVPQLEAQAVSARLYCSLCNICISEIVSRGKTWS